MPRTNGKQQSVLVRTSETFYDAGGASAKAPTTGTTAVVFTPRYGQAIEVTFSELDLGSGVLYVYEGRQKLVEEYDDDAEETTYFKPRVKELFALRGSDLTTKTFHATTPEGALTFVFVGASPSGAGWKAEVKSVDKIATDQPVPQEPAGSVYMVVGPRDVQVGTSPIAFYDDGGPEGKISEQFEGSVTFIPERTGQRIQITFEKLDLFSTNPAKNDQLNVYNGRSEDPAQLLKRLLTDPVPVTLLSGAADGSLTVSLKSTTGVPKDGFVARVKAVDPQPMHFVSATATYPKEKEPVAAGGKGKELLAFTLQTEGVSDPLSLQSLELSTEASTAGVLKHLTLYAGTRAEPSAKIGEVEVTGTTVQLQLTEAKTLSFGGNTFLLTGDVSPEAKTGDKISLALQAITLSGKKESLSLTPQETPYLIKNTHRSHEGEQEIPVYSDWTFTPTMTYGHYSPGNTDQVTIFSPGRAGEVIQLDFHSFEVLYQQSSTGTKATFEIYEGKGRSGKLLWKLDEKTIGGTPGLIHSSSADGALTVVFNPKATTSGRQKKGWEATVRSLVPSPMKLVSTLVEQASTEVVAVGAKDLEFLDLTLETKGYLEPKKLEAVGLRLKGGASSFARVALYSLPSPKAYRDRKLLGEITSPTSDEVTLTLTEPLELKEGKSYYYLTADLTEAVEAGVALDLALPSLTLSGEQTAVASPDPDGSRTARRFYSMKSGEETISVSAPITFYDDGGADGKYTKGFSGTVHFVPRPGEVIRCRIHSLRLHRLDALSFYHGMKAEEDKLLQKFTGYKKVADELVSTAADGSMTVTFSSKFSDFGWEIEVRSERPVPVHVESVKVEPIPGARLMKGASDVPLLKIAVKLVGEQGAVDLERFDFAPFQSAGSESIGTLRLYKTGTSETFSTKEHYASINPAEGSSFAGSVRYSAPGTYYFFLAASVSTKAPAGGKITVSPRSVTVSGEEVKLTEPPTTDYELQAGLHGDFTIGTESGAHFKTITEAIEALKTRGVDGPVRLRLSPGHYTEPLVLPAIPGLSLTNPLVIEPTTGRLGDVTLENKQYKKALYGDDKPGYFTLDGADYVTLRALSFLTTKSEAPALLLIRNSSQRITIDGCSFTAPKTTQYNEGDLALIKTNRGGEAYPNNDHLTLTRSKLTGGYVGVHMDGLSNVALPNQQGLTIEGNTFSSQGSKGIYVRCVSDVVIRSNEIQAEGTASYDYHALDLTLGDGITAQANRIHLGAFTGTKTSVQAVYLRQTTERAQQEKKASSLINNELILTAPAQIREVYGFYFSEANMTDVHLLHNSVLISGDYAGKATAPVAVLTRGGGALTGLVVKNNLWQNATKGLIYSFAKAVALESPAFASNLSYTAGSAFAELGGETFDLGSWTDKMSDASSQVAKVDFVDPARALLPQDFSVLRFAPALTEVPRDILGVARPKTEVSVGAYEEAKHGFPALVSGYPKPRSLRAGGVELEVKATDFGAFYCIARPKDEAAPSVTDLKASDLKLTLYPQRSEMLTLPPLKEQTAYRLYLLPQGLDGAYATGALTYDFATDGLPSEPADFEALAEGETDFTSGTYHFTGATVYSPNAPYKRTSQRAVKLSAGATVRPTNTVAPVTLSGFYLKSTAPVKLTALGGATLELSKTLPSTEGLWRYVSLRDLGALTSLQIDPEGEASMDDFTADPLPLQLLSWSRGAKYGEEVTLVRIPEGGVWPYTFLWRDALGKQVSDKEAYTLKAERTAYVTLEVTDAWDQKLSREVLLKVTGGPSAVATFEDLALAPESAWYGRDGEDPDDFVESTFYSGTYAFSNSSAKNLRTWMGFAYSNQTKTDFSQLFPDQFNSSVGHGVADSKTYGVAYAYGKPIEVKPTNAPRVTFPGFYVTNTAWVKKVTQEGTKMGNEPDKPFHKGDYLLLVASTKDGKKSLEFPLIDYRADDAREHYVIDSWQWFDLTALGEVEEVRFSMKGSRQANGGTTIPAYFCLDNFGGEVIATESAPLTLAVKGQSTQDVAKLFTEAGLLKQTTPSPEYSLVRDGGEIVTARLEAGRLELTGASSGEKHLLLRLRQGGRSEYLRLPIVVTGAVTPKPPVVDPKEPGEHPKEQSELKVYPNPATTEIYVSVSGDLEIYNLSGQRVLRVEGYRAGQALSVAGLPGGVYLARTAQGVVRFIKR